MLAKSKHPGHNKNIHDFKISIKMCNIYIKMSGILNETLRANCIEYELLKNADLTTSRDLNARHDVKLIKNTSSTDGVFIDINKL